MCDYMNGPWRYYAKRNKSGRGGKVSNDFTHT